MTNSNTEAVEDTKRPHLVHTARVMFETRWAKYNDPRNLEWDFDADMAQATKWERHAWSAYLDLAAAEKERDSLLAENERLKLVAHDFLTATEDHSADNGIEYARSEAKKALGLIIECAACSEAGGADRAIYHRPPACESLNPPEKDLNQ